MNKNYVQLSSHWTERRGLTLSQMTARIGYFRNRDHNYFPSASGSQPEVVLAVKGALGNIQLHFLAVICRLTWHQRLGTTWETTLHREVAYPKCKSTLQGQFWHRAPWPGLLACTHSQHLLSTTLLCNGAKRNT